MSLSSMVRRGTVLERCVVMGTTQRQSTNTEDEVQMGIGRDCHIRNAIIDSGARIGDGSRLLNEQGVEEADGDFYCIRGGVIVVPAMAVVPPGTVI